MPQEEYMMIVTEQNCIKRSVISVLYNQAFEFFPFQEREFAQQAEQQLKVWDQRQRYLKDSSPNMHKIGLQMTSPFIKIQLEIEQFKLFKLFNGELISCSMLKMYLQELSQAKLQRGSNRNQNSKISQGNFNSHQVPITTSSSENQQNLFYQNQINQEEVPQRQPISAFDNY